LNERRKGWLNLNSNSFRFSEEFGSV